MALRRRSVLCSSIGSVLEKLGAEHALREQDRGGQAAIEGDARGCLHGRGRRFRLGHFVNDRAASRRASAAIWPIGTCQGLASPHSPRMVTIISSGKAHTLASDSVLMQFPTPLLCISRTPRSPPSQAPA